MTLDLLVVLLHEGKRMFCHFKVANSDSFDQSAHVACALDLQNVGGPPEKCFFDVFVGLLGPCKAPKASVAS